MANDVTKRVPLELMCLSILEEKDMYGYDMVNEFNKRSKGRISINVTTLYMSIKRLEEKGYVSSYFSGAAVTTRERIRVYYHLEPSAAAYKEKLLAEYQNVVLGVQDFLNYDPNEQA